MFGLTILLSRLVTYQLHRWQIADRMIAMALPCVAGAAYRNDIRQVSPTYTHYIDVWLARGWRAQATAAAFVAGARRLSQR